MITTANDLSRYAGLINDPAATVAEKAKDEGEDALAFDLLFGRYLEKIHHHHRQDKLKTNRLKTPRLRLIVTNGNLLK